MFDEPSARALAQQALTAPDVALGDARELREGWFFSLRTARIGGNGLIVNKKTGRVLHLGTGFPIERDLELYDRGYQFWRYDLVILAVHDVKATRSAIARLDLKVVTPTYEHGQVWRVPRSMTDLEIRSRLETLPCIFPAALLYFRLEVLEEAKRERWFDFVALEYSPKRELGSP
jgi:hypothetical protein